MYFIKKSVFESTTKNEGFTALKNEVLSILKKQLKDEKKEIAKALFNMEKKASFLTKSVGGEIIEKAGYPVGTIREWKGKKFIKIAPNKWKPKYDSESRGAKNALTRLIKQVENCKDMNELMKIVMENKQRFTDANGNHLPIVDKLRAVADKKNDALSSLKAERHYSVKENRIVNNKSENVNTKSENDKQKNFIELQNNLKNKYSGKIEKDNRGLSFPSDMPTEDKIQWVNLEIEKRKQEIDDYESDKYAPSLRTEHHNFIVNGGDEKDFNKEWNKLQKKYKKRKQEKIDENEKEIELYKEDLKFYETEAEKHANRSKGMMGNQNAKKDFRDLENSLVKGQNVKIQSKEAGDVLLESGELGKHGYGLKHIIEQRFIKDGKSEEEIAALLHLILESVRTGSKTRENGRTLELTKNGIVAILRKEPNDKGFQWVLTGFDNTDNEDVKKEATDAISTVIANNNYAPEFSSFRNQVGAVIASMNNISSKSNSEKAKEKFVESLTDSNKDWIIQCIQEIKQNYYKNENEMLNDFIRLVFYPTPKDIGVRNAIDELLDNTSKKDKPVKFIWETFENAKFSKLSKDDEMKIKEKIKQNEEEIKNVQYDNGEGSIYTNRQLQQSVKRMENENKILKQKLKDSDSQSEKTKTLSDIRKKYESSKSVTGNSKTYRLPDGSKIKCHYKLVEADAPTASHDETTYKPNEALMKNGSTINDRDYAKDKDAQESVRKIAQNYNGLALQEMPVVTKDGVVVSGNNRTMSSKLAAKQGTDTEYLDDLKNEIEDYGIDEDELKNFKHPRLILEIDEEHNGEYTTEEFAKFNKDTKKTKNTVEKAVEIAKTVKPMAVSSLADTLSSYDTMSDMYNNKKAAMEFAEKLVTNGIIQKNELSQYYTEESGFSEAGKEFVETVLTGSVLSEENLRSIAGAGGKSIRRKLVRAILPLIDNKGMGNEYSFNDEFNNAVKIAVAVNKNHETYPDVKTYLKQDDMFAGKTDELTGKLAEIIHDYGEKNFSEKLKDLNAGLRPSANGEFDMFLGRCESRNEILDRLLSIHTAVKKALNSLFRIGA